MPEVIHLNQKRKAKARSKKEAVAAANRIKFGRNKAEKDMEKRKAERAAKHLQGHKRETNEE